MSFILDQLKKSGRKRELEMAMRGKTERPAPLGIMQPPARPQRDRISFSLKKWHLAAAALTVGGLLLSGAFALLNHKQPPTGMSGRTERAEVPVAAAPVMPPPSPPEPAALQESPNPPRQKEVPAAALKPEPALKPAAPVLSVTPQAARPKESLRQKVEPPKETPVEPVQTVQKSPPPPAEPPAKPAHGQLPELRQLPQSVRKTLPELKLTSHLYKHDSKLVSINGRIMSEGSSMEDGLYLEEITPEGAVLSMGKHRFLLRAER